MHCCADGHPSGFCWFSTSFSWERLVLEMDFEEEEMLDLAKKMTRKIKIEQHMNMTFRLIEDVALVVLIFFFLTKRFYFSILAFGSKSYSNEGFQREN